ncbi:unnamed protein product [Lactuca saligna]|uniref:Uncharacterized protein n=1 Tax=Lactuca saligna TaxID=75948 RepID=A0AA35ZI50_LACSI|nr:unnamed protein product [Lactuca saligna]
MKAEGWRLKGSRGSQATFADRMARGGRRLRGRRGLRHEASLSLSGCEVRVRASQAEVAPEQAWFQRSIARRIDVSGVRRAEGEKEMKADRWWVGGFSTGGGVGCHGENDSAIVPQIVRLGSEGRRERGMDGIADLRCLASTVCSIITDLGGCFVGWYWQQEDEERWSLVCLFDKTIGKDNGGLKSICFD